MYIIIKVIIIQRFFNKEDCFRFLTLIDACEISIVVELFKDLQSTIQLFVKVTVWICWLSSLTCMPIDSSHSSGCLFKKLLQCCWPYECERKNYLYLSVNCSVRGDEYISHNLRLSSYKSLCSSCVFKMKLSLSKVSVLMFSIHGPTNQRL